MNNIDTFIKSKLYNKELVQVITYLKTTVPVSFCVAGGALTNILINQKPNDYDIYFLNENDYDTAKRVLNNSNCLEFVSGDREEGSSGYNGVYYTHNVLGYKLNLVGGFFGKPEHIISQFDLSICCIAVDSSFSIYTIPSMQLDKVELDTYVEFRHVHDIYATTGRALKYSSRGFKFRPKDLVGLSDHYEDLPQFKEDEVIVRYAEGSEWSDFYGKLLKLCIFNLPDVWFDLEATSPDKVTLNMKIYNLPANSDALHQLTKTAIRSRDPKAIAPPPRIVYDLRFDSHPDGIQKQEPTILPPIGH